ncbi:hypothetical protein H0910_16165 [Providencia alcalifaciens]|uniref:hypothetical protein n=1 Tax=Providencia alcalifaciens TaxID=126385 RepID=UPI0015EC0A01|nr:hypothetical protein [Providencia alcalifaciens]EJF7710983.1 hypothetical protein [Providencia rettgeri]QLQ97099.1 hypothetical protein H0910_16165 [Providencia alcalifaciens]
MKNSLLIIIFLLYSFYAYSDEDKAISVVSQYIKNELLAQKACVSYQMYQEDQDFYYIKVRTENRNKLCAGDPNISVTLFNFKISKRDCQLYKEDELGINGYQSINDKNQYIHCAYSYKYTGEKLNDGNTFFINWTFNFIDNRTVNLAISSWHELFRCDGNYDIQYNKNEIDLSYNKNNEYECDENPPQFTIKEANG